MASRRYTYATCLTWGGDEPTAEVEVEVSFAVIWGSHATRHAPATDTEVWDIRLEKVEGRSRPWDMGYGYLPDDEFEQMVVDKLDDHSDQMIEAAAECAADDQARVTEREAEDYLRGEMA